MKPTEPRDLAAILIATGAVAAAIVATYAGGWLRLLAGAARGPLVVGAGAGALLGLAGLLWLRGVVTRRALGRRVRVQLVPTDDFDPSDEAVVRFAAGLGRTRRAVRGLLDRRASAARLRLAPDRAGRLGYYVDLPAHARGALSTATYDELELHDLQPGERLDDATTAPGGSGPVARVELVLARSSTEPLRLIGLDPDPLGAVARAIAHLNGDAGEHAVLCVDLMPVTAAGRRRAHRQLLRQARREQRAERTIGVQLGALLDGGGGRSGRGGARPAELVQRRVGQRALSSKLGSPEPLFQIQVLVQARAASRGRAVALAQSLAAAFDQFGGENYFRASGGRLPGGLAFLGSDSRLRRRRFDERLRTGRFRPARRRIVAASEIAGLLKPPSAKCHATNVVRCGGLIPPPPSGLPTFHGQRDLLPLGRVATATGTRSVGVPLRDTFFSYMGGRSRYGKTETAVGQFVHLARAGHGCFFLDPHEDALAKIKHYLTDQGLAERVVEINLADLHRQPSWNLLAVHGRPPERRTEQVDAVVDAFASALGWDETNTRALNLIAQATQALTDLAARLPAALAPTLFQVPTLLSDERWRMAVLPYLSVPTRQFFLERFPRLSAEAITPVTNLVDRLRVAPSAAALLGCPTSTYDVRRAMDQGLIVLACPGSGSARDRLIANFLVYDLLHAAKTRAELPPDRRRPFYVFLDEVQTYDGGSAGTLAALLEQSAKYGIRALLLNQNPERLNPATWNAVSTNRSHLAATALNAKAAALVGREWAGQVKPEILTNLRRYSYLASVTLAAEVSPPFLIHGIPVDELFPDAQHPDRLGDLEATIDRTTGRRPVADTVAHLDGHDDAILNALNDPAGRPAGGGARRTKRITASGERPPR